MKTPVVVGVCAVLVAVVIGLESGVLDSVRTAESSSRAVQPNEEGASPRSRQAISESAASRSARDVARQGMAESESRPQRSAFLSRMGSMLAEVEREADPDRREQLIADLVFWLEGRDVGAALKFLTRQKSSELISDLQGRLLQQWAEKDPQAAANAALAMTDRNRREALETVLGVWADAHLSDAIAWVHRMPEGVERQNARLSLALEAARTDPEAAVTLASELPNSPERDEMILHAASQWAASDPENASVWAHEIEDIALREHVLAQIATAWSESDPASAAKLAIDALPPGKAQNDVLVSIVQRWTQKDPGAVAAWVSAFPEGALRSAAMENFVKLWADGNARPAGEWLNGLAPSPSRNNALRAYSEQIAPSSPRDAAAWASAISGPLGEETNAAMLYNAMASDA